MLASVQLPDSASLARTEEYMNKLSSAIEDVEGVKFSTAVAGYDMLTSSVNTARGIIFVNMEPGASVT